MKKPHKKGVKRALILPKQSEEGLKVLLPINRGFPFFKYECLIFFCNQIYLTRLGQILFVVYTFRQHLLGCSWFVHPNIQFVTCERSTQKTRLYPIVNRSVHVIISCVLSTCYKL